MASKARQAFDRNVKDVERLLAVHVDVGGDAQDRRYGLEVDFQRVLGGQA